jgi:hypothetical protein
MSVGGRPLAVVTPQRLVLRTRDPDPSRGQVARQNACRCRGRITTGAGLCRIASGQGKRRGRTIAQERGPTASSHAPFPRANTSRVASWRSVSAQSNEPALVKSLRTIDRQDHASDRSRHEWPPHDGIRSKDDRFNTRDPPWPSQHHPLPCQPSLRRRALGHSTASKSALSQRI